MRVPTRDSSRFRFDLTRPRTWHQRAVRRPAKLSRRSRCSMANSAWPRPTSAERAVNGDLDRLESGLRDRSQHLATEDADETAERRQERLEHEEIQRGVIGAAGGRHRAARSRRDQRPDAAPHRAGAGSRRAPGGGLSAERRLAVATASSRSSQCCCPSSRDRAEPPCRWQRLRRASPRTARRPMAA